jgi:FAD/FMN-containing dehydrogenase
VLLGQAGRAPSPHSAVLLESYGGAAARVAPGATAYPHRGERFNLHVFASWLGADDDGRNVAWAREFWDAVRPASTGAAYVNFLEDEGEARARTAFGANYDRLVRLKRRYDPDNLFRRNQNVRPAGAD